MPTAIVVIDSGFSQKSLSNVDVIGAYDLTSGKTVNGDKLVPVVPRESLTFFDDQYFNHGSEVLTRLAQLAPNHPFVLVRAFGKTNFVIRTKRDGERIVSPGWTDAYFWAVALCKSLGYSSVANCSFGADTRVYGEHQQVQLVTGPGKPGHILVAAALAGDEPMATPAYFPEVVTVGFRGKSYPGTPGKPEILLDGDGPISFRLPEITARVVAMLDQDPTLDVTKIRCGLRK